MRELYPAIDPFVQHSIDVGDGHVVHAAEFGRPDGQPVLVIHGGPGAGSAAWHARLFDPEYYRVVQFDQRGCGQSLPHGSLDNNTTAHLLADMERIREHLAIDRWYLLGGSWGATLAILYAGRHGDRVDGVFLRGVFLGRPRDIDWLYGDGARRLLPEAWADFVAPLTPDEHDAALHAHCRRLFGEDDIARMTSARAWVLWEMRAATLQPDRGAVNAAAQRHAALATARIGCHYFTHDCWLGPDEVLATAATLGHVPAVIVHGRHDLVCPVEQAVTLATRWPGAELEIVEAAGHAGRQPAMTDALIRATDRFVDRRPR